MAAMTKKTRAQTRRERSATRTVEDALDGWLRFQEKRCDPGEWAQLRDLLTPALLTFAAQEVEQARAHHDDCITCALNEQRVRVLEGALVDLLHAHADVCDACIRATDLTPPPAEEGAEG